MSVRVHGSAVGGVQGEYKSQCGPFGQGASALAHVLLHGFEATLDRQGRVLIPTKLAQYAGLRRDVTVTGVDDRLEIWDTEEWNRYVTGADESFAEIVEEFAGRDLGG